MSIAKITMIGLETALAYRNESIFDLLKLPEGIDADTVENNILMEGGEFEVVYAEPDFFKQMVGIWSKKHYRTFEKWTKALSIDYAPLENYDRFEEWDDTGSENSKTKRNGTTSDTSSGSVNNSRSEHDNEHMSGDNKVVTEGKTENEVSAFDSNTYQPENQSTNEGEEKTTSSNDRTASRNSSDDTSTHSSSNGTSSDNEDYTKGTTGKHVGRIHGNVGVTTSQQMLRSELDIAKFNIVQQITDLFLQEFCIMIYS